MAAERRSAVVLVRGWMWERTRRRTEARLLVVRSPHLEAAKMVRPGPPELLLNSTHPLVQHADPPLPFIAPPSSPSPLPHLAAPVPPALASRTRRSKPPSCR